MLFSPVTVKENEVETRNDNYRLENLTVVSARRQLPAGALGRPKARTAALPFHYPC